MKPARSKRTALAKGVATFGALKVGIHTGVSKLVVHLTFVVVAQYFVGFRRLLEFFGGLFVSLFKSEDYVFARERIRSMRTRQSVVVDAYLVGIRMELFREFKVRLFNGALIGISIDTKRLVKVSLGRAGKASSGALHGTRTQGSIRKRGGCQAVVASRFAIQLLHQWGSVSDGSATVKGASTGRGDSTQPQSSHGM